MMLETITTFPDPLARPGAAPGPAFLGSPWRGLLPAGQPTRLAGPGRRPVPALSATPEIPS